MQRIAARLGHHADLGSFAFSIFRPVIIRQNVELPDRVNSQQVPAKPRPGPPLVGSIPYIPPR